MARAADVSALPDVLTDGRGNWRAFPHSSGQRCVRGTRSAPRIHRTCLREAGRGAGGAWGSFCPPTPTSGLWTASTCPHGARPPDVFSGSSPQSEGWDLVLYPKLLCLSPQATESPSARRGVGERHAQVSEQVKDGAEELRRLGPAAGREHRRGAGADRRRAASRRTRFRVRLDVTYGSVCCSQLLGSRGPAVNFSGIWRTDGYLLGRFQSAMAGILTTQRPAAPPVPCTPPPAPSLNIHQHIATHGPPKRCFPSLALDMHRFCCDLHISYR